MSKIETLVEDMQAYISGGNPGDLSDMDRQIIIQHYSREMKEAWDRSFNSPQQGRRLRMSNWGKCGRELWYEEHPDGRLIEKLDPNLLYMFTYGHVIELQTLMLVELAGHSVQGAQWELEVGGISGHCDAIIDGYMFDVKSTNDYSFRKFQNGLDHSDDLFGYLHQLNGYYAAATKNPEMRQYMNDVPKIGFLAVNKSSGDFCVDMHKPWNPDETERKARKVRLSADDEQPPARLPTKAKGTSQVLDTQCKYCSWKFECWKDMDMTVVEYDNKYSGKKTKEYFTEIGAPLKTPAINKENLYERYEPPRDDLDQG